MNWRVGIVAVVAVAVLFAAFQWQASRHRIVVGFWYEEFPFTLGKVATARLGGPLTDTEIESITQISRVELERAFAGLGIAFSESRNAFWSIRVILSLARKGQLPHGGETLGLGPLGARSAVSFDELAAAAFAHAPPDASRQTIIEGIGRGIGRAAAHELAHAIVGVSGAMDNETDDNSYEYFSYNRPSQYYGELHWTAAWPLLEQRLGT